MCPPMLERAEAVGEARVVLERLELGLGKRIVVRDVRARSALGDAEVGLSIFWRIESAVAVQRNGWADGL